MMLANLYTYTEVRTVLKYYIETNLIDAITVTEDTLSDRKCLLVRIRNRQNDTRVQFKLIANKYELFDVHAVGAVLHYCSRLVQCQK